MNNYPPGAENDPRAPYNQPDHSHDHRWEGDEYPIEPVIEDGAAIFVEDCLYAEGRWGEGWQCEETRTYRFEYSILKDAYGNKFDLPAIEGWDEVDFRVRRLVERIEEAYHNPDAKYEAEIDADPDPDEGVVVIEWNGYTLRYEP